MSASQSSVNIEDSGVKVDLRASIRLLHFKRRLFHAIKRGASALAFAAFALFVVAVADYRWALPHMARAALLSLILVSTLSLLACIVWNLMRRSPLVDAAREVERAAGINRNAVVTMIESFEGAGTQESRLYMLARLERQARVELSSIDERVVAPRRGAVRGACALAFLLLVLLSLRLIAPLAFAREAGRVLLLARDDSSSGLTVSNSLPESSEANAPVTIKEVRVRILPPAYSGLSVEEVAGDAPLRALAGSQVEVTLTTGGTPSGATLSFNGPANQMRSLGAGQFAGIFTASESGAFEARLQAYEKSAPAPLVRAVEVYNDLAP
ncbi:MAG: hypothetical protein M3362_21450, partial [Acidobacteriota bacterium]|nr:hypothetical protein [Acidobacteriota bacterium]